MKRVLPLILMCLGLMACDNPEKITDPHHPAFKKNEFRWDDYPDFDTFSQTLKVLLPIGTDRHSAEGIILADPEASASSPESLDLRRKKTGGFILGEKYDQILSHDPDFKSAQIMVKYSNPASQNTLTPTSRSIIVFYSGDEKLLNIILYNQILYIRPLKEQEK